MNVAEMGQLSIGQLIAGALGIAALGVGLGMLLAAGLHVGLHAAGALVTRPRGEKKFSVWLLLLALSLAALVGGWTGLQVGVARAAVPFARDHGLKMAEEALQSGLRQAGLTNFPQLDVKKLREFVDKAETVELPPLQQLERFRSEIEAARTRLLPVAKALLDAHAKEGKLSQGELVAKLWPKVLDEITAWEQSFRRGTIIIGVLLVVGIEMVIALTCLALRLVRDPPRGGPPQLPKT